jgi:pyruvate ferredoxin oxidoreductase delta subunit
MKLNVGTVCGPGGSKKNKTGHWRSFRPVVEANTCTGCGICFLYCPDASVKIVDKVSLIDYEYCKGCGICAQECPKEAITMKEEKK